MSKSKLQWEFAKTGGGDETGINDPVISNFVGKVSTKLVREALQNSIDAGICKPVKVDFNFMISKASKIPGIEQLHKVYSSCVDYWSQKEQYDKDVVTFYNKLLTSIQRDLSISILKISDYNTRGLTPKDYRSLFKLVGGGTKGKGEGGSFGLGRGAYFGASLYRMILVSSKYDEDKYFFAGKARLVSFFENGEPIQGNGTYGYPGQNPVTDGNDIPLFFKRNEKGTDFYIYEYQGDKDWKIEITKSVLDNFWYAIFTKKLVVKVGEEIIDYNTIKNLMIKYYSKPKTKNEWLNCPYPFYLACTSEETHLVEENLPTLGSVKLYILKNEIFPSKVAYIRGTGMTIQTKKPKTTYGYAGVFVCEDDEGNEILRKTENPEHDEWRSDIAIVAGKLSKQTANDAMDELKKFVLDTLKSLQEGEKGEELHFKDLDKYLWLPIDEDEPLLTGASLGGEGEPSDKESASEIAVVNKQKLEVISKKEKLEITKKVARGRTEGDEGIIIGGGGGKGGDKVPCGTVDEEGDKNLIIMTDFTYRAYAQKNDSGEYVHTLIVKALRSKKIAKMVIRVGTDSATDDVGLWSAIDKDNNTKCERDGNTIKNIELSKEGKREIEILFEDGKKYSLNVTAYEHN